MSTKYVKGQKISCPICRQWTSEEPVEDFVIYSLDGSIHADGDNCPNCGMFFIVRPIDSNTFEVEFQP